MLKNGKWKNKVNICHRSYSKRSMVFEEELVNY